MTTALRDAIDHTALGWVKPEIDETLRQARLEIEAFAESPADVERMQACAGYLHQVQGTLRMLELRAPAMVAEEMEQLAQALVTGKTGDLDEACSALMRGVVQLPDYLERLQGGHRDIPIVLLPLLNELRAARGAAGLAQDALPSLLEAPSEAELEHARGSLAGRNRALLDTVSAALKEDLLRVKDALDLHLRSGTTDGAALKPQAESLDRIGETLGMVGLEASRGVIQVQGRIVHAIANGERPSSESELLDVAGALIYIEHSLDDQVSRLGQDNSAAGTDAGDLLAQESRKVMATLAREAVANFAEVRNAFVAFVETDWDHAALEPVPRLLAEVAGAMRILQLREPADYLEALRRYSHVELISKQQVPGGRDLDTLADALAGMEYYLESLDEPHGQRNDLLDKTRESLEALAYWPLPGGELDIVPPESAADTVTEVLSATEGAAIVHDDVPEIAEQAAVVSTGASAPLLSAGFDAAGDEIDDEIREIFLEEFEEEINNLDQLLPIWRRTPDGAEQLRPIRRVFHTLKGSGRLVGAKSLGEFSWHVETMLNRVLDGSRPASHAVVAFVNQTRDALPQLLAALRGEAAVSIDLAAMEAVADRLAAGEDVLLEVLPVGKAANAGPSKEPEPPVAAAAATVSVHVDQVLLEILGGEVGSHLETVDAWLAQAHAGQSAVTDSLLRAIHTLNGAFAMTEVPSVTAFTTPAEGYVKRLLSASVPADADGIAAIGEVAEAVRASTLALKATPTQVPVYAALISRVAGLRDALPEASLPFALAENTADIEATQIAAEEAEAARMAEAHADAERIAAEEAEAARVAMAQAEAERVAAEEAEAARVATAHAEAERVAAEEAEAARVAAAHAEAERVAAEEAEAARVAAAHAEAERVAGEEAEAARIAAAQAEAERVAAEEAEAARVAAAQAEAERIAAEEAEAARIAAEQTEAERAAAAEAKAVRIAAEQAEAQRIATEVAEAARVAAAQAEIERVAAEEAEAARIAAAKAEAERVVAEEAEAARLAAEHAEAERLEAGRIEAERLDMEKRVAEEAARVQAERAEAERLEAERIETDRLAAERIMAARAESERIEAARVAAERAEAARVEAERRAAEIVAAAKAREQAALAALLASATSTEDPDEALDMSELDPELVDIFVEEGGDLLDHSDGLLAQLRESPTDREPMVGLQRDLHTLKGGARMAGVMPVGELGHAMETLLEAVVAQRAELGVDGVPLLERGFDRLHGMITRVAARRAVGMPVGLIDDFNNRAEAPIAAVEEVDDGIAFATVAKKVELKPLSSPMMADGFGDDDEIGVRAPQEQVRIRADLLDRLVNYAGEVAIYRSRLEQQLGAFRGTAAEMEQTNIRLRDQLRRLDAETEAQIIARFQREQDTSDRNFDPLELDRFSTLQQLSRALGESAADLVSLHGSMDDLTRQYETLLLQQSRVSSELQEGLMRTRMVPFDALVPRLRRVIRQATGETGKNAQLKLDGAQGELDRNVLERMTAPLEHMLRNAVAHGLESPEARLKAGKPAEGSIRVAVRREGSEVVLQVSDDGCGLDRDAIRSRAIERGLIKADAILGDSDLYVLILEPGFSTAQTVSRLAGRGVGMDVVASEVRQLGGSLDISSIAGEGTMFTLRLPQTLAVTRAVFVKIGDTQYAVPIASVRGVDRITREELAKSETTYRYGGEDYALHDLGRLVGTTNAKAEGQLQMPLLLVRSGDLRAAVVIDQVVGNREIVVKSGGPQLASIPGIFGATIMGDGSVVVILDVAPLVRRAAALPRDVEPVQQQVEHRRVPLVMVVDDSVTMRKVTSRVLERNNFEVATAKDGIDALERMADMVPDLMLLDIEMPRMDGYELATAMKADPRMRNVPIIMITSRTGDKHRQRAIDLGVERYLGKPYQEVELMRNVFDLLGVERAGESS
jgi:chemosensory pili system protein ChpA (sensor histidine kinase/response regulator)